MRTFQPKVGIALLAMALVATAGHAQRQAGSSTTLALQPVVAALYAGNSATSKTARETPTSNNQALAGAQDLSSDAVTSERSYWQPFFNLTSSLDTNLPGVGNTISLSPLVSGYAGADLRLSSHRSDFSLNYLGGGVVSQYSSQDRPIQQLTLGERLTWRHASLSFLDQFGYLPEAIAEFYLPTSPDPSGNRETSRQAAFLPNTSIYTTLGQELTNSALGELDVPLTQHSSLTYVGSYSVVRFFNDDLLNLDDTVLQAGFNRQLTRDNSVALLYRFDGFRFSNIYQPMDGHMVQLAFGRQVTGGMSFRLAAGPELGLFRTAIEQSVSGSLSPAIIRLRKLYWTADASMNYFIGRTVLKLGYNHSLSDGAGFLAGAITDQAYGSIDEQLARRLTAELTGGYAKNQGLVTMTQSTANEIYRDWFAGVTISHAWSRRARIFLSYQVQRQASNFACTGFGCGNAFTRQVISIGLTGRSQPRLIG